MPPEKNYIGQTSYPGDDHRIHMIKFLIDCTGMSIPEAQQVYEMVKATSGLYGEARTCFKQAIHTHILSLMLNR